VTDATTLSKAVTNTGSLVYLTPIICHFLLLCHNESEQLKEWAMTDKLMGSAKRLFSNKIIAIYGALGKQPYLLICHYTANIK